MMQFRLCLLFFDITFESAYNGPLPWIPAKCTLTMVGCGALDSAVWQVGLTRRLGGNSESERKCECYVRGDYVTMHHL